MAFDSVHHEWIFDCLKKYKINSKIINFFHNAFIKFESDLVLKGECLGKVNIERGIFQGDSLSPLLFIISLFPLSETLNNTGKHLNIKNINVNHLLYLSLIHI